jgi:Bacterial archaeo-eukaryotic release factor family 10
MARPTLDDARELSEWQPRLGVLSVYLRFQPGDRDQTWRAELRNELRRVREELPEADHERQMAVIATTDRVLERLSDEKTRPPPRGEAGFVEVVVKGGAESWWATHEPPPATTAALAPRPLVASLVEIAQRDEDAGVVLVSAERVRLLRFAGRSLDQLEEMEITLWIRDWRERKSSSSRDPARA